ncbi:MAG: N-formylglutamate amidohydrolase [Hyphomicrobium sp.]|jgi:N-formylglutamate amidohydrolase|nr:N-formylglutamate amidohydrolase [Hyphomicrobium sp.]PPD08899.1 MAG: N-formylglutamate amidohydrolase [Hyphomicrobium sp.]
MASAEEHAIRDELTPPFEVREPLSSLTPFVFCSPHSGRIYPRHFLASSRLDATALRRSEDCYVDELFIRGASRGATLLSARFPRAYIDANREPYELDPELFSEPLPDWANARSVRVAGGLGTIARIVADGEEIYQEPLALQDALTRIELLYKPFHAALRSLIERAQRNFGYAILIDCHSMPSAHMAHASIQRPDFVIGDRFGTSCDLRLTKFIRSVLTDLGYEAQLNRPYAGGYITEHYGRPLRNVHAIQLEINRGLYMNEKTLEKTPRFIALERDLLLFAKQLFAEVPALLERRSAAE